MLRPTQQHVVRDDHEQHQQTDQAERPAPAPFAQRAAQEKRPDDAADGGAHEDEAECETALSIAEGAVDDARSGRGDQASSNTAEDPERDEQHRVNQARAIIHIEETRREQPQNMKQGADAHHPAGAVAVVHGPRDARDEESEGDEGAEDPADVAGRDGLQLVASEVGLEEADGVDDAEGCDDGEVCEEGLGDAVEGFQLDGRETRAFKHGILGVLFDGGRSVEGVVGEFV